MTKTQTRIVRILTLLKKTYPDAKGSLVAKNPLELLIATMLSAQCTDARVNIVTKSLFQKYKTAQDYCSASQEELENDIHSTGFYHTKARNIRAASQMMIEHYNGKVPDTMEELLTLRGVARKTANIVLAGAYGIVEGIAVDTHVTRLSRRLGLSKHHDTNKIEKDLMKLLPKKEWHHFTHLIIDHGRAICLARKPRCNACPLEQLCPKVGV